MAWLGHRGGLLGVSLGASLGYYLGQRGGLLEASWGALGIYLEPFGHLGCCWKLFGALGGLLGAYWGLVGELIVAFGRFLGKLFGAAWVHRGRI